MLRLECRVVCVDINMNELNRLEADLKKTYPKGEMHLYQADISSLDAIKALSSQIKTKFGHVDILINNAGIMNQAKLFLDSNEREIQNIFNINVLAHMYLCKQFLPDMIKNNKGHIVNVASALGLCGAYKLVDYSASKFACVGFTESLRLELKILNSNNKINVSLVCPFHVKTSLFNGFEMPKLKWYYS